MTTEVVSEEMESCARDDIEEEEWQVRVQLAACYRILDYFGWTSVIANHISARVPGPEGHLLINPYGLMYSEVTASNLMKIDLDGNIIGSSDWPVNPAGIMIHTAIHGGRPDIECIFHTHTLAGSVVAGLRDGLEYNSLPSVLLYGQVAYHDFEGFTVYPEEQAAMVSDLGDKSCLILRNHGLVACGTSLPQGLNRLMKLEEACRIQVAAAATGLAINSITEEARTRSFGAVAQGLGAKGDGVAQFAALCRLVSAIDPSYAT
jgi:ribulose-5-phosphate 4-epimerase/fuculose-1-phosphate aldolase